MVAKIKKHAGVIWAVHGYRALYRLNRHWILVPSSFLTIFVGLPWLAPLFMEMGWTAAGEAIYLIYRVFCHQLPQRSFFLFGEQLMVPLETVQSLWADSASPLILRQFNGNAEIGWKVAWSDRMVYMYTSILLFGILFWILRKRLGSLTWKVLLLFPLPMAIDGTTHVLSEISGGIGGGFRYTNDWLAILTGSAFPTTFYVGDGLGSFNSWLRLITGILFGLGVGWFAYPLLHCAFANTTAQIETKFLQANRNLER